MDILEARQTLYDAIATASGLDDEDMAFPNVETASASLPRLEVEHVTAMMPMWDVPGQILAERGTVVAIVVSEKGIGEASGQTTAQAIVDAMPIGTTYNVAGGGGVQIWEHPSMKPGYADSTSWRIPIEIRYLATDS
jgi:hypothetical protein